MVEILGLKGSWIDVEAWDHLAITESLTTVPERLLVKVQYSDSRDLSTLEMSVPRDELHAQQQMDGS